MRGMPSRDIIRPDEPEEVIRPQVDAPFIGAAHDRHLVLTRDHAAGAAASARVCPPVDARYIYADHLRYRLVAAAFRDDMRGCVAHARNIAIFATRCQC